MKVFKSVHFTYTLFMQVYVKVCKSAVVLL